MKKIILASLVIAVAMTTLSGCAMAAKDFPVSNGNDSGAGSLREAISSANAYNGTDGVTITVNSNVKLIQLTSGPLAFSPNTSTQEIALVGNGVTIQQSGNSRIANVTMGKAIFNGVTFTKGAPSNENGGAVYVGDDASARFINCTFFDNTAIDGGAVYINSTSKNGNTSFLFCSIAGNTATGNGGGVAILDGVVNFIGNIVTGNTGSATSNDIYAESVKGVIRNSSYNILGVIPANGFEASEHNQTGIDVSKVFSSLQLEQVDKVNVLKLSSSSFARDYVPEDVSKSENVTTDECGKKRPQLAAVDAGAFEASPVVLISADINGSGSSYVTVGESTGPFKVNVFPEDATLDTVNYPPEGIEWKVSDPEVLRVDNQGCRETTVTVLKEASAPVTLSAQVHYWKADGSSGGVIDATPSSDGSGTGSGSGSGGVEIYPGNTSHPEIHCVISNVNTNESIYVNDFAVIEPKVVLTRTMADLQQSPISLPYTLSVTVDDPSIVSWDVPYNPKNTNNKRINIRGLATGTTKLNIKLNVYLSSNRDDPYDRGSDPDEVITVTVSEKPTITRSGGGGGCSAGFAGVAALAVLALALRRR